jgi:hypothetical protein
MRTLDFWIEDGCLVDTPTAIQSDLQSERAFIQSSNFIKVEVTETGTTIRWTMFACNWASLFFVQNWIHSLMPPFTLRFFNGGWFSERYETARDAAKRIEALVAKADVRFSARVFTRNFEPKVADLPETLRQSWEVGLADPTVAVVCAVDPDNGQSQVERVGHKSAIASIWGVSPVSFPCLSGHSYDRVVSGAYINVVKNQRPNFSHVIAAMTQPDGETRWYGYQRVIFPGHSKENGLPSVHVVGHVSPVDIPLL